MLSRFNDPSDGSILLDGFDLRSLALKDLRDAVAIVPQKPFLFDATVRENIEMGKSPYTTSTVEDVAEASHASGFIGDFPDRFDQRLGENGNRLSGGQLQGSCFLQEFSLLVLDEATSALDTENGDKIQKP